MSLSGVVWLALTLCVGLLPAVGQAQTVEWAQADGGSSNDEATDIAVDASGNSYVTGTFSLTATFGSFTLTSAGLIDIFVAKYDSSGNVLWARSAGGPSNDEGLFNSIAVDAAGNIYVTGNFLDTANFGPFTLTSTGFHDIFVAKYDAAGNVLWARSGGGPDLDEAGGISVDTAGNIYVTGRFISTATFGSFTLTGGDGNLYLVKYDSGGNVLWAKSAGGTGQFVGGRDIAVDAAGNSYVIGSFLASATFGPFTITSQGGFDIFVAKYDANGNVLWVRSAGSASPKADVGGAIAIDSVGNSYVTGTISATATFGPFTLPSAGPDDVFVVKYDADGNVLWARSASGTDNDAIFGFIGIAVDTAGSTFVAGNFRSTATFGPFTLTNLRLDDIFVAKYDSAGSVVWAQSFNGTDLDGAEGIGVDSAGNSYIAGRFSESVPIGPFTLTTPSFTDVFVAKMSAPNVCGNGLVGAGEQCDGGLGCTGCLCDASFEPTTPTSLDCWLICGNGSVDPGEQCDGTADAACPGVCLSDCTCGPFCGDGVCDPAEDSCNCAADCGTPPSNETLGSTCADGIDNDCDGLIDSADPDCTAPVPTVSAWGMIVMVLLLLAGAKVYFNRRRSAPA